MRSQQDIMSRFFGYQETDPQRAEVLSGYLTEASILALWPEANPTDYPQSTTPLEDAIADLPYGYAKVLAHRDSKCQVTDLRLVEKSWVGERDDVIAAMNALDWPFYGAARVMQFEEMVTGDVLIWGALSTEDQQRVINLGSGQPCDPACVLGCIPDLFNASAHKAVFEKLQNFGPATAGSVG